jgi:hypothetical protein
LNVFPKVLDGRSPLVSKDQFVFAGVALKLLKFRKGINSILH